MTKKMVVEKHEDEPMWVKAGDDMVVKKDEKFVVHFYRVVKIYWSQLAAFFAGIVVAYLFWHV